MCDESDSLFFAKKQAIRKKNQERTPNPAWAPSKRTKTVLCNFSLFKEDVSENVYPRSHSTRFSNFVIE